MSPDSAPLFHSSATPGYSSRVSNDPRHVVARKRERDVQVQFAAAHCTVQTPEGPVHANPGDAVVTDSNGEQWRVSRARFAEKYRPVAPTRAGEAGRYTSLPIRVLAVQLPQTFAVLLADGQSKLTGQPDDWLVDYGDGSLGVVSRSVFPLSYEILT